MNNLHVRVLLLEDNPGDADLVALGLKKAHREYEVQWAKRLTDAIKLLEEGEFDVVLSDLSLPDSCGLQSITCLREHAPNLPVVVLTSLASDDVALDSLDKGAQDYLVKDALTADALERAIRYAIHRSQSRTEIQNLLAEVQTGKRLLEKKNRRLTQLYKTAQEFVDNVSHEFRTPLTVIKEYAALVREGLTGPINEEQEQMLAVVEDRVDDLNIMVEDMLDISKLDAGTLSVRRTACRVADITEHIRVGLERKAEVKGVLLEVDVHDDLPLVYCDAEKVGRTIVNLVVNAIKFCGDPGMVRLLATEDVATRDVVVQVSDNGPGIDRDKQAELFRRFRQLGIQSRGTAKGFGLGLNIARDLADLNFGEMRVESEVGVGSTFSFTLPVADPAVVMDRFLARITRLHRGPSMVSLVDAGVDSSVEAPLAEDVDFFLGGLLKKDDLVFRISKRRWLLALPIDGHDLTKFLAEADQSLDESNRNRPRGPLPEVRLTARGTWHASSQRNELLGRFAEEVKPVEAIHAY